jgi:Rrf2 family protein
VRVSAKADYAVRAMLELVESADDRPIKGEALGAAEDIPVRFLENILAELRHAGLVHSRRGSDGGYWLGREAGEITVADVIRAVEGPLATIRGEPAEELDYPDGAKPLKDVWIALRTNIREILESVTLADLAGGGLPDQVRSIAARADLGSTRN